MCSLGTPNTLDTEIVRTVWHSLPELEQQASRLRSPLVLATIHAYLAGKEFPLDLIEHLDH